MLWLLVDNSFREKGWFIKGARRRHHCGQGAAGAWLLLHPPPQGTFPLIPRQSLSLQLTVDSEVVVRLVTCLRQSSPFLCKLLRHSTDMVRLEPAASTNVSDAEAVGLPGPPPHLPPGEGARLQGCRLYSGCHRHQQHHQYQHHQQHHQNQLNH